MTMFCTPNAQSIKNKTVEFQEFVLNNGLNVIGISETWPTHSDSTVIAALVTHSFTFQKSINVGGGGELVHCLEAPSMLKFANVIEH